jgi:phenylpropionate dioxygenase-like ring-hydroxylating dioxygenase large terminal subunit
VTYLMNCWYVAAWAHEVEGDALLERTLLDRSVLIYRKSTGEPVAIGNRCPHRFAPLADGKRFGDEIACPYHGLRFDSRGVCVFNPHAGGHIPPKAKVPAYPMEERHGLLWIWMGEAAADPATIPDLPFMDDPGLVVVTPDRLLLACNYELAADNLMDLSHAVFVHDRTLGNADTLKSPLQVREDGEKIHADIWAPECMPGGSVFPIAGPGSPVDHWLEMSWEPASVMLLKVGTTLPGQPRENGVEVLAPHLLTPETSRSTHYFFATVLPHALVAVATKDQRLSQRYVFENEDEPILSSVQRMMGEADLWSLDPVLLPGDAGAVRVRRRLKALIEAEGARATAAAE